jgi:hypothetical protein
VNSPGNVQGRPPGKGAAPQNKSDDGESGSGRSVRHGADKHTPPPHIAEMRRLLAALDSQHARERQAYADGYRDGHRSGWETGYAHAHHEMAAAWAALAARVRAEAGRRPVGDLDRLRRTPGGPAYEARIGRHGDEHEGGPVEWHTGQPARGAA